MGRYSYSDGERALNAVLKSQARALAGIRLPEASAAEERITRSEELLASLGFSLPEKRSPSGSTGARAVTVPSWEELSCSAVQKEGAACDLEELFSPDELAENREAVRLLNEEFDQVHRLDAVDIAICASAGIVSGIADVLLTGIPEKTQSGLRAGPLSDCIRGYFEKRYPEEEMSRLAGNKLSKVPYDAQDNRNISPQSRVEGLSSYYHRLLSLGHDPLLGLVIGTADILAGTMTTIDKKGNVARQVMECYADRTEADVFAALAKQLRHFASDVNTSMGLPAPLMGLFNLVQAGSIGEYEQTVAEVVQGMYYEGYDFVHFCSMSVPVMLSEVVVRIGYALKRMGEGCGLKESIPVSIDRGKHPKLATMLFTAHSASTAINAGKIYFSGGNPMAINYPQWVAFAKYSFQQLRWALLSKPELRDRHVMAIIGGETDALYRAIDESLLFAEDGAVTMSEEGEDHARSLRRAGVRHLA